VRSLRLTLVLLLAAIPAWAETGFEPPPVTAGSLGVSPLTLASSSISSFGDSAPRKPKKNKKHRRGDADSLAAHDNTVFGAQRASVLLRSLTVPGWGQATLGRRHAAAIFGVTELGIWSAFTAFRVQQIMRAESYTRTAKIFAGIDVSGRDEEFRRIVGAFTSSDEYNLLVVSRDAANLYMQDVDHPDMAGYRAYIAAHSLTGSNSWSWADDASFRRYRSQRKDASRANVRANSMLAAAIAERLVSAAHAAWGAGRPPKATHTSWNIGFEPGRPGERVLFRTGLSARF
jgi:hypothetical protein